MHFSGAFLKYSFSSVALLTKKLWAILDFFSLVKLFHGDSVKNESARTKKL